MNLLQRRITAACAVLTVTTPLLTGCGLLPGSSSGPDAGTVTVWLMKDSASPDFLKRFTEEFERDHAGTKLNIESHSWEGIGPKINKALAGENPPDVIEVGNTQVAQYADRGGLQNLTLESVRDFGGEDWLPGLAQPGSINNAQFGIPWYAANRVVIYHKDLFRQAGVIAPPRDRKEWIKATRKLNTGGNQGIYLAGQDWYTLSGFIWDEGGELATESAGKWNGALHSAAALKGMEFYQELQALGDGPRDADEEHPPQAKQFARGDVAQIIATPGVAKTIEQANPQLRGKIGFFPLPGKTAQKPGKVFIGGSDLVIPERTDQRRAAVEVVKALSGEKWQADLARTMNYVPNKSRLASAVAGEEGVAAMAKGAGEGRATPASPKWGDVEADNPIKRYMTKVLTGATPLPAAKAASAEITEVLQRIGEEEE